MESVEQWKSEVIDRKDDLPVIIQFSASWCQPCQILRPVLENMIEDLKGEILYFYIDIAKFPVLTDILKVSLRFLNFFFVRFMSFPMCSQS